MNWERLKAPGAGGVVPDATQRPRQDNLPKEWLIPTPARPSGMLREVGEQERFSQDSPVSAGLKFRSGPLPAWMKDRSLLPKKPPQRKGPQ